MAKVSYKDLDDIYYHESGHAILATIFSDVFIIRNLTTNENVSGQYDSRAIGGLRGNIYTPWINLTKSDHDKLIIIFLAGISADDINNTSGRITESMYEYEQWMARVDQRHYWGDGVLIMKHFEMIENDLGMTWEAYMVNSMRFLHRILNDNVVWRNVYCIAKALDQSPDKTLTHLQIQEVVAKEGLDEWIRKNIDSIVWQRRQLFVK
jgi:hypothetical protein